MSSVGSVGGSLALQTWNNVISSVSSCPYHQTAGLSFLLIRIQNKLCAVLKTMCATPFPMSSSCRYGEAQEAPPTLATPNDIPCLLGVKVDGPTSARGQASFPRTDNLSFKLPPQQKRCQNSNQCSEFPTRKVILWRYANLPHQ